MFSEPFKVRKNGKTVGRRSKAEKILEQVFAFQYAKPKNQKMIREFMKNTILYGNSLPRKAFK